MARKRKLRKMVAACLLVSLVIEQMPAMAMTTSVDPKTETDTEVTASVTLDGETPSEGQFTVELEQVASESGKTELKTLNRYSSVEFTCPDTDGETEFSYSLTYPDGKQDSGSFTLLPGESYVFDRLEEGTEWEITQKDTEKRWYGTSCEPEEWPEVTVSDPVEAEHEDISFEDNANEADLITMTETNDASGKVAFSLKDLADGSYTFRIRQYGSEENISYDNSVYEAFVDITDGEASVTYSLNGESVNGIVFENRTKSANDFSLTVVMPKLSDTDAEFSFDYTVTPPEGEASSDRFVLRSGEEYQINAADKSTYRITMSLPEGWASTRSEWESEIDGKDTVIRPDLSPEKRTEEPEPFVPTEIIYVPTVPEETSAENAQHADTIEEAFTRIADGGLVCVTADIVMDEAVLDDGRNVAINSYGDAAHIVTKDPNGSGNNMFAVTNGSKLTVENLVLDATENTEGRTINLTDGSELSLKEGAVLENNTNYGAVFADKSSVFIEGGTIRNNQALKGEIVTKITEPAGDWTTDTLFYTFDPEFAGLQKLGGAVLMLNGSSFAMSSGSVEDNSAVSGGAVYAYGAKSLSFTGGSFVNNTAAESVPLTALKTVPIGNESGTGVPAAFSAGGAICVENSRDFVFDVSGMMFINNEARRGGAVYLDYDVTDITFTVIDSVFSGNHASEFGSVLYSFTSGLNMDIGSGSVFEKNSAEKQGALYFCADQRINAENDGEVRIHDGAAFRENSAATGACFFVQKDSKITSFTIDGAEFVNNTATGNAGVGYVKTAGMDFSVRNSRFEGNASENAAGCFYIGGTAFETKLSFTDSKFANNKSGFAGVMNIDGVERADVSVVNCTFSSNSAVAAHGGALCIDVIDGETLLKDDTFTDNTAENVGGAVSMVLTGGKATISGGSYERNKAQAGGAVRTLLGNKALAVIDDGAVFDGNSCKVNAGGLSFTRKEEGDGGYVQILECDIVNNFCEADFSGYGEEPIEISTVEHYNTGGLYVGEDVTAYLYDALITDNRVEGGYENHTIGSGIGLCPDAKAYFYPDHGAMVYGNGPEGTMDILAVPYDDGCVREGLPKLYVCDRTPDGREYNWSGLNGKTVRSGAYNWDNALGEISTVAYDGEDTLDPVGFKANVSGIMPVSADDGYKVRITGNYTKSALYGGGGLMVNGILVAGQFYITVEKQIGGNATEELLAKDYSFSLSLHTDVEEQSFTHGAPKQVPYTLTKADGTQTSSTIDFIGHDVDDTEAIVIHDVSTTFSLKGNEKISIGPFQTGDAEKFMAFIPYDVSIHLEETDNGGAVRTEINPAQSDNEGLSSFDFVCTNYFGASEVRVGKAIDGEADDTEFRFLLKKITEIDSDQYAANGNEITAENFDQIVKASIPANDVSYEVFDTASESSQRTGTTGEDGIFTMKGGQYAELSLEANSKWLVNEDAIPVGYTFKEATIKSGENKLTKLSDNLMLIEIGEADPSVTVWTYTVVLDSGVGTITDASWKKIGTETLYEKDGINEGESVSLPQSDFYWPFLGWRSDENNSIYTNSIVVSEEIDLDKDHRISLVAQFDFDVKYAVSIYGICQDLTEDGSHAGLTFGPATGQSYVDTYKSHVPNGSTTSGNIHRCVHDDSWETIIEWASKDPYVYEQCVKEGCTHTVALKLPDKLKSEDAQYPFVMTGDGASLLYSSLNSVYRKWNNEYSNEGGWPASRIRTTLNGKENCIGDTNEGVAGTDLLSENEALISAFPEILRNAIVPKAVKSDTAYGNEDAENVKTTYDKLWLFSGAEIYMPGSSNTDVIRNNEGLSGSTKYYLRAQNMNITTKNYSGNTGYNESGSMDYWWLRSLCRYGSYGVCYVSDFGDWSYNYYADNADNGAAPGFCLGKVQ